MARPNLCVVLMVSFVVGAAHVSGNVPSLPPKRGQTLRASKLMEGTASVATRTAPIRVAYQGEPGAYSEKSLRELLGPNAIAVARPTFEACYRAVASREADYALLPFENSLGGSIHDNYDLMLRYDLQIIAEHEFRVSHCLLAMPGVSKDDIKYCISHPQALAQCDNYLRGLGIAPVPMYDTAGSAKLLSDNARGALHGKLAERALPDKCNPTNTAAIASDMAGVTYGLDCLESAIEDDTTNFTRFLLLGRSGVSQYLNNKIPAKTSIVFTLPNSAGALYKALACFSMREIDFSKIESRPTSASLLSFLKFRSQTSGKKRLIHQDDIPRFRYCFYLDFLASDLNENAQNALHHLSEQAEFCRILGSYPQKSRLVGPVFDAVEDLKHITVDREDVTQLTVPSDHEDVKKLKIGIVGYGVYGQFLGKRFSENHAVSCIDILDKSMEAEKTGAEYFSIFEMSAFLRDLDVVVLAIPLVEFEDIVASLPNELLRGKLVVEVCPLGTHPKSVLLRTLSSDVDIICSHPMFGPNMIGEPSTGTTTSWDSQPMVYEKVRILDSRRADAFLDIFQRQRCQMIEMTAEQHDEVVADAEFVTHLTGRILDSKLLPPTPISSIEYAALCDVADRTSGESFDHFYGMFKFNSRAPELFRKLRDNLARVERQLAQKEAYLAASSELRNNDRQKLLAECRQLLQEVARNNPHESSVEPSKTNISPLPDR